MIILIAILFIALIWLYAFSDDILYRLAVKKAKRAKQKHDKANSQKGSDPT